MSTSISVSLEDAIKLYYDELRSMAHWAMANERANHSLQPTELVHDLVRELIEQGQVQFNDRRHVFAYFRRAFQNMLTDHSRKRNAQKRGRGWTRVSLSWLDDAFESNDPEAAREMCAVLEKLKRNFPRVADVVVWRYFLGFTEVEIATKLGISDRTVRNDCRFAKAWLRRELGVEPIEDLPSD